MLCVGDDGLVRGGLVDERKAIFPWGFNITCDEKQYGHLQTAIG